MFNLSNLTECCKIRHRAAFCFKKSDRSAPQAFGTALYRHFPKDRIAV